MIINDDEKTEIAALKAFRDSIDNSLKEYLHKSVLSFFQGIAPDEKVHEEKDRFLSTPDSKAEFLTNLITDQLKWRYKYEWHMQFCQKRMD